MGKSVRYTYGCYYKPDSEYKPTCFAAFYARRARQQLRQRVATRQQLRQRVATPTIITSDDIDIKRERLLIRRIKMHLNS